MKNEVYKTRSDNTDELKEKIIEVIDHINTSNILENVSRNFYKRMNLCVDNDGSHIEQLL